MKKNSEKEPLISIIIPVYNGEKYIDKCLNSILNQDYKNIEVILINDGSKDDSKRILDDWAKKSPNIKVIHQENSGVSTARNVGIEISKGLFITFVDVDDYIANDFISYYYNLIKEYKVEIALTPMPKKFNSYSEIFDKNIEDNIQIWSGEKAACEMLYYNIAIGPWNKLISKELIDKYNIRFNPELAYGEGFNFSVDCFQRAKKVAVGSKKVYYYRVDNPNSAMTKFRLKLVTGSIEAQKCIVKNLVNNSNELLDACKYANWHTYCDCFNSFVGCNVIKQYKEKYKEIKKVCRRDALCVLKASIPFKEKIKGALYFISPYLAAKIINRFRLRKFTVES